MKTILHNLSACVFACFFALHIPVVGNAQNGYWPPAVAVTDSTMDNLNVSVFQPGYLGQDFMFWERHVDASTSEICMRDIYATPLADEQVVLAIPGTQLTHPVVFNTSRMLALPYFYLFYETNEGSDIDIKYVKYYTDGTFSAPFTFVAATGDDINLRVNSDFGLIAWENGGKVMVAGWDYMDETFSEPLQVDSDSAYSPAFFGSFNNMFRIGWLKQDGYSSYLKYMDIYFQEDSTWLQNPDSIEIAGDAQQLKGSNSSFSYYSSHSIAFQKRPYDSDKWGLCLVDFVEQSPPEVSDYHSANYNNLSPAVWDVILFMKGMENSNVAFVSDSLGNSEILATQNNYYGFPDYLENVSNYSGEDRNPSVFFTEHGITLRTYLLWESFRNGHWTICNTYSDIYIGSTGQSPAADNVLISPNPFKEQVSLRIKNAAAQDNIRILNMQGQCINTLKAFPGAEGWLTANWDGRDTRGNKVPTGSYIVVYPKGAGVGGKVIVKME